MSEPHRHAIWLVLAILWLVYYGPAPALGHTPSEIAAWEDDWRARAEIRITPKLLEEYADFQLRHRPPPRATSARPSRPANTGMGTNVEQWRSLVAAHFGNQTDRALCIMRYESGGNPGATNPTSGAAGLFQIMPFWWDHFGGNRYDPATNTRVAAAILARQGWTAWSPYNRGLCH